MIKGGLATHNLESNFGIEAKANAKLHIQRAFIKLDKSIGELSAMDIMHTQVVEQIGRLSPSSFKPMKRSSNPLEFNNEEELKLRRNVCIQVEQLLRELIFSDIVLKTSMIQKQELSSMKTYATAFDTFGEAFGRLHKENLIAKERIAKKQAQLKHMQSETVKIRWSRGYWCEILQSVRRPLRSSSIS